MDRFLSGDAPVQPPRAAICSKTSRREASSQPPRSWESSRSQFETPAPLVMGLTTVDLAGEQLRILLATLSADQRFPSSARRSARSSF